MTSMKCFFKMAGLCDPHKHSMLFIVDRMLQILESIEHNFYFLLHAPRQVGKTTTLVDLSFR